MPKFFPQILTIDELPAFSALAYVSRCVQRVVPFDLVQSQLTVFDSIAARVVDVAQARAFGAEAGGETLDETIALLEGKARVYQNNGLVYLGAVNLAAANLARAANFRRKPAFRTSPGITHLLNSIRTGLQNAVDLSDKAVGEFVLHKSLPTPYGMFSFGASETPEYVYEEACRIDIEKLASISSRDKWPEWGRVVDSSPDGPLGALWSRGEPKGWPPFRGIIGGDTAVLISAIVSPYAESPEGELIRALGPPFTAILKSLEHDPEFLYHFTKHPRQFEEFIAAAYDRAGFDQVTLTPQRNDGGRDVIAVKNGFGSIRILEQTKAYSAGRRVTHDEVRAMLGALALDSNASKGIITTTADFQPGIAKNAEIKRFMPHRLELKNGQQLREFLLGLRSK